MGRFKPRQSVPEPEFFTTGRYCILLRGYWIYKSKYSHDFSGSKGQFYCRSFWASTQRCSEEDAHEMGPSGRPAWTTKTTSHSSFAAGGVKMPRMSALPHRARETSQVQMGQGQGGTRSKSQQEGRGGCSGSERLSSWHHKPTGWSQRSKPKAWGGDRTPRAAGRVHPPKEHHRPRIQAQLPSAQGRGRTSPGVGTN